MENIEDMKTMWIELNERVKSLEDQNRTLAKKVIANKYKSTKEKLIKKYLSFSLLSFIMIIFSIFGILMNPFILGKYKWITFICWICFFLFEGSIDLYLCRNLQRIDVYNTSFRKIAATTAQNWKVHKLAVVIGLPFAVLVCILYALAIQADVFAVYGMVCGAFVGLIIASFQLKRFYSYYRLFKTDPDELL